MSHNIIFDRAILRRLFENAQHIDESSAIQSFISARQLMINNNVHLDDFMRERHELPFSVDEALYARLIKVITLTKSDKQGESIAAFMMARRLMDRLKLTFNSILKLDDANQINTYSKCYPTTEIEIIALRKKVRALHLELSDTKNRLFRYKTAFETILQNVWLEGQSADQRALGISQPSIN